MGGGGTLTQMKNFCLPSRCGFAKPSCRLSQGLKSRGNEITKQVRNKLNTSPILTPLAALVGEGGPEENRK